MVGQFGNVGIGFGSIGGARGMDLSQQLQKQAQAPGALDNLTTSCEPKRTTEIPELIDRLFVQSQYVSDAFARLEGRLYPVLIQNPEARTEGTSGGPLATSLGLQLGELCARFEAIANAITSVYDRVQL